MGLRKTLGGCLHLFFVAVLLDVIGLVLLFIGIFANLRVNGLFYGDFLIYTGALLIFFSLGCWLMWYVGNVPVSEDDGGGLKKRSSIVKLARRLTERLSQKLKGKDGVECGVDEVCSQVGRKASRVTWGRSTAYHNEGYDDSLDSLDVEKKVEKEKVEV